MHKYYPVLESSASDALVNTHFRPRNDSVSLSQKSPLIKVTGPLEKNTLNASAGLTMRESHCRAAMDFSSFHFSSVARLSVADQCLTPVSPAAGPSQQSAQPGVPQLELWDPFWPTQNGLNCHS